MLKAFNLLRPKAEIVDPEQPEVEMSSVAEINDVAEKTAESLSPSEPTSATINTEEASSDTLEEIYTWIDQIPFSRTRRNVARDFSDGVLMAELLKRYYPRHVDLHNYTSKNSIANKIDNWSTLNRKVLSKIGMKLSKDVIMRLAYSESGAVESVLGDLRSKILKDCNAERDSLYFDYEDNGKGGETPKCIPEGNCKSKENYIMFFQETVKSVLNSEEVANKTVPRQAFVKLKHELQEKKSVISTLSEKLSHLESLVKLKDQRIADLTAQINGPAERTITPRPNVIGNGTGKFRIDTKAKAV